MKTTINALIVAGVMLGLAAMAAAAPPRHGGHHGGFRGGSRHGGFTRHYTPFYRSPRTVRSYPRSRVYVPRRVIYPLTLPTPTITIVRRSIVVAPEPDPADVIQAQLNELRTEYYKLAKTRQSLLNWLAGPGQSASSVTRMRVETRVALIERDCTRIAGQMAELQLQLAML